ncbi:hydantoin utilization protein A [Clostridiales bacterium PH28_bin88]|nr:hydantoin utilization protein A [Clostridiales bacterium PH28_bin88]
MKVFLAEQLQKANRAVASDNRRLLAAHGVTAINIIGGPGAGKTTLLEKTLERLAGRVKVGVIEGDIYTTRDAERLDRPGVEVIQINTRGACHLDANMVGQVLGELALPDLDLLFIENVGNLVCPAEFDLGEDCKVAVLSVAEGGDKPAKYPLVFHEATAAVLTKSDLLPYTDFRPEQVTEEILGINPELDMFLLSARSGEGIDRWCDWLERQLARKGFAIA